jgi:hypothetical protein
MGSADEQAFVSAFMLMKAIKAVSLAVQNRI